MSDSSDHPTHINLLVEKLRRRLKNFTAVDMQGNRIGKVEDFVVDTNHQLNLVVSQFNNLNTRLLIISKLIQKIEPANKVVVVDTDRVKIENLPVFESSKMENEVQNNINLESSESAAVLGEEVIRLLEERLVVERIKRKVGEVVVRKVIETRMVEIPVRYEKLIVEQVGSEHKQLAEIHLGQEIASTTVKPTESLVSEAKATSLDGELTKSLASEAKATRLDGKLSVSGSFTSPKIASLLLNAIALERQQGCQQIRIEIVVENAERQKTYQEWFDRCSLKE